MKEQLLRERGKEVKLMKVATLAAPDCEQDGEWN